MRKKYEITPQAHEAIHRVYLGETGKGQIRDLARRLHLPRWAVSKYARNMGWVATHRKAPNWSESETRYLSRLAHLSPDVIQRKMAANGYRRSVNGIVLKMKRLRLRSNFERQSATSLALCLGVDAKTITRAIEAGRLRANRRGTARTEAQGGDMWWIDDRDVAAYIMEYLPEIDFRKVDKYWLVDLLLAHGKRQRNVESIEPEEAFEEIRKCA